jgi:hypothetical protein
MMKIFETANKLNGKGKRCQFRHLQEYMRRSYDYSNLPLGSKLHQQYLQVLLSLLVSVSLAGFPNKLSKKSNKE